jgi:hypothetical protein
MDELGEKRLTLRDWAVRAVALALWLLTGYLGVLVISATGAITEWFMVQLISLTRPEEISQVTALGQMRSATNCLTIVFGLGLLIALVGGGEYHMKYVGTRRSWVLFAIVIGIELAILGFHFLITTA